MADEKPRVVVEHGLLTPSTVYIDKDGKKSFVDPRVLKTYEGERMLDEVVVAFVGHGLDRYKSWDDYWKSRAAAKASIQELGTTYGPGSRDDAIWFNTSFVGEVMAEAGTTFNHDFKGNLGAIVYIDSLAVCDGANALFGSPAPAKPQKPATPHR